MSTSNQDLTVVLPVWDGYVGYLEETVATLQAQIPQPRILLVDNCSSTSVPTFEGAEIVRAPERRSLGAARTFGLSQVETEFVLFWDADDHMPPGTIDKLVSAMRANAALSLLAAPIEEGGLRRHHWPRRFTRHLARYPMLLAFVNCISSQLPAIGSLIRTQMALDAGGFPDAETGDDWVLGVSLAFRGRVGVIDHVGRIYHLRSDSVWAGHQTPRYLFEHARAVRERIRSDPAAPDAIKRLLPMIAAGQWVVIRVLRPLRRLVSPGTLAEPIALPEEGESVPAGKNHRVRAAKGIDTFR